MLEWKQAVDGCVSLKGKEVPETEASDVLATHEEARARLANFALPRSSGQSLSSKKDIYLISKEYVSLSQFMIGRPYCFGGSYVLFQLQRKGKKGERHRKPYFLFHFLEDVPPFILVSGSSRGCVCRTREGDQGRPDPGDPWLSRKSPAVMICNIAPFGSPAPSLSLLFRSTPFSLPFNTSLSLSLSHSLYPPTLPSHNVFYFSFLSSLPPLFPFNISLFSNPLIHLLPLPPIFPSPLSPLRSPHSPFVSNL